MSQDLYHAPDYFQMDELLTEEHKLIRDSTREWVKREVSPIIENACQKAEFPNQIIKGLAEVNEQMKTSQYKRAVTMYKRRR